MITNIKLTGMYNIGVNDSNNIDVNGTNVSLKDIPFVRYAFDKYGTDELDYIKRSMQKFAHSAHLVEIKLTENTDEYLEVLSEILDKVAKYIYIDVTQQDMDSNTMNTLVLSKLAEACSKCRFDRIMLVDKTTNLDMVTARKFIKEVSVRTGVTDKKIGICSSPLCMTDNLACLTAVTARELAAVYATSKDVVSPSANHQDMNCCGCMRFFTVTSDIEAPAGKVKKVKEKKDKPDTPKQSKSSGNTKKAAIFSLAGFR